MCTWGRRKTAAASWKASSGWPAAAPPGGSFPNAMGSGTASTSAFSGGVRRVSGSGCPRGSPMTPIWNTFFWIAARSAPTRVRLALRTKGGPSGPGIGTEPGRLHKQGPRECGCAREPPTRHADRGPDPRHHLGRGPAARDTLCPPDCGQRVRCGRVRPVVRARGAVPVIPPRSNRRTPREYDAHLCRERHLVECFFSKVKQFRHVFSRFDKLALTFLGFVHFVNTLIWLR